MYCLYFRVVSFPTPPTSLPTTFFCFVESKPEKPIILRICSSSSSVGSISICGDSFAGLGISGRPLALLIRGAASYLVVFYAAYHVFGHLLDAFLSDFGRRGFETYLNDERGVRWTENESESVDDCASSAFRNALLRVYHVYHLLFPFQIYHGAAFLQMPFR